MQPHAAERHHLERQIAQARPIFLVLALGDLLERPPQDRGPHAVASVLGYLAAALALVLWQYVPGLNEWTVPLGFDLAALAVFILLTHSAAAFWFLYLFVALAAGIRWGMERSIFLAVTVTLAVLLRATWQGGASGATPQNMIFSRGSRKPCKWREESPNLFACCCRNWRVGWIARPASSHSAMRSWNASLFGQ